MSNTLLWLFIGLLAGGAVAAQGPVNAELAKHVGSAVNASFTSFLVGTLILLVVLFAMRTAIPAPTSMAAAPWWAWSGGVYGALLVTLSVIAIPKVGVAPWIGALIAGQLAMSLVYDHMGAFNQVVRSITWERATGVSLLLLGAWLIQDS